MSNFTLPNKLSPNKLFLVWVFCCIALSQGSAGAALTPLELLKKGNRKAALEMAHKEREIVLRQFVLADNFQKFQDARAFFQSEYWAECLDRLKSVTLEDELNLDVLELKATCEFHKGLFDQSARTAAEIIDLDPQNPPGRILMARTALERKQYLVALNLLREVPAKPLSSEQTELVALLKARAYNSTGNTASAIQVLQEDHEKNLEHLESIFRLGELYDHIENKQWNARRYFSLFVTRCHRLPAGELQKRKLEPLLDLATRRLAALDASLTAAGAGAPGPVKVKGN